MIPQNLVADESYRVSIPQFLENQQNITVNNPLSNLTLVKQKGRNYIIVKDNKDQLL